MTDNVKLLRERATELRKSRSPSAIVDAQLCLDAADEIELLRNRLEAWTLAPYAPFPKGPMNA